MILEMMQMQEDVTQAIDAVDDAAAALMTQTQDIMDAIATLRAVMMTEVVK